MSKLVDERKIDAVYWPDSSNEYGRTLKKGSEYCDDIYLAKGYSVDEYWIVQAKDGKEIARHNPRYVETIIWET